MSFHFFRIFPCNHSEIGRINSAYLFISIRFSAKGGSALFIRRMGGATVGGLTLRSGLFDLPANVPHYMTLGSIGRDILGSRESAVIYTPCKAYHLTPHGHPAISNGSLPLTFHDSMRIIARSHQPGRVINRFSDALELVQWRPCRYVAKRDVIEFVGRVTDDPKAFSESYVHAQLDLWRRGALRHLCNSDWLSADMRDYAAYMIRYIQRMYPRPGAESILVGGGGSAVVRFGRKEGAEGSAIGYYGWPLEGRLPENAVASVRSNVELVNDWRKGSFIDDVLGDVRTGGIRLTDLSLRRGGKPRISTDVFGIKGYKGLFDIQRGGAVKIATMSSTGVNADSFAMFTRAVNGFAGDILGAGALRSSMPAWWRLDANPFDPDSDVAAALSDHFRGNDRAYRIFSAQQWMREQYGMSVYMNFGHERRLGAGVYGIVAEGYDGRHASALRNSIRYVLQNFGEPVDDKAFMRDVALHQPPYIRCGWPVKSKLINVESARVYLHAPVLVGGVWQLGQRNLFTDVLQRYVGARVMIGRPMAGTRLAWSTLKQGSESDMPFIGKGDRFGVRFDAEGSSVRDWDLFVDMVDALGVEFIPHVRPRGVRSTRVSHRSQLPIERIEALVREAGSDTMLRMSTEAAWHVFTPRAHVELKYPGHDDERYVVWDVRATGRGAGALLPLLKCKTE